MLNIISTSNEPGTMLSKTGRKLNFEFANVARYYGQSNFLRNTESGTKQKPVEVKYPRRLLEGSNETYEPFKLAKGRDFHKDAKDYNSRAPPVGTYNPKKETSAKVWRLYNRENPLADARDTFMKLKAPEATPTKADNLNKKSFYTSKENIVPNIARSKVPINSEMIQSAVKGIETAQENAKRKASMQQPAIIRKSTINYWDQFKHEKQGIGLIDFNRQYGRSQTVKKGYREYDLKPVDLETISSHQKVATDIYFFNKANMFKKPRNKFVKKMNFYNVKLEIVKPKLVRMVPAFDKEVGRRPHSVGNMAVNHNFYDYEKIGRRMPVIDFDKQLKL